MPVLRYRAGEIRALPLEFLQPDGSPTDLTGATVLLTAAPSAAGAGDDPAATPRLELSRDEHADPETGRTSLLLDLSELPAAVYATGLSLVADIWLVDTAGERTSYGLLRLEIGPSVTRDFPADED